MAKEYTLEELMKMGAKPVEIPPEGLSLEELQAAGAVPAEESVSPAEPMARPNVGPWETFVNKATDAVPLGRLVSNLSGTALLRLLRPKPGATLTPQAQAELEAMGEAPLEQPGLVDTYRDVRDTRKERTAAGSEQNPVASGVGTGAGITLSMLAPGPKAGGAGQGVTLGQRLLAAGKTGAAYGALSGATDGEADLTRGDVLGVLEDTAKGAGMGFGSGVVVGGVSEALRPLLSKALKRYGIQQAKQAIQGGSDIAAATRKPMADEAAVEALESGAIQPLSTTEATANRIEKLAADRGAIYGKILDDLEAQGVQGPNVKELADQIYERYVQEYPNYVNSKAIPGIFKRVSKNVEEAALPGPGLEGPARPNLGLRQTERLKQEMQNLAKHHRVNTSPAEETFKELGSTFRQVNEDAVAQAAAAAPAGSPVRELGTAFKPVKEQLARTLEARHFARPGASKAGQRSPVGLKDMLLGASTGDPLSAAAVAAGSSLARNRLPSTLAYGSYRLGRGLETGTTASDIAAALGTNEDVVSAIIAALRKRQNPPQETP